MSDTDQSSKTEEPTEKKLKKAREKGDVPTSKEVGHLLIYGGLLACLGLYLPANVAVGAMSLGEIFDIAGAADIGRGMSMIDDIAATIAGPISRVGTLLFGILGILLVAAILSGILQGPFVFSTERIAPKLNKISPLKGVKKLTSMNNLVEFAKSFVKLLAIGGICLLVAYTVVAQLLPGAVMLPEVMPGHVARYASLMLLWIVFLMIPITFFDIAWKRFSYNKKQRMSLKEIRDEHKDSEGDPQIKAKREGIRRQRARQRIQKAVPTATLVVTNPTHFAVALRYERGVDAAPVCVAKGTDLVAKAIRHLAYDHEVPVIESRALARALYATCEVDETVPEAHWPEVAQLVGFVLDLRRKIKRKLPAGASWRHREDE